MTDDLGPRPEGFFNIRYIYTKDIEIFPTILSNEAMTSEEGLQRAGARFEMGHLVVLYKNYRLGYWHFEDYLEARGKVFQTQLENNTVQNFIDSVNNISSEIADVLLNYDKNYLITEDKKQLSWDTYKKVCDLYREICTNSFTANLLDKILTDTVKADLSSIITDKDKLQDVLLALTRTPGANYIYVHDLELIKLLRSEYSTEDIDKHADKWCGLFGGGNITDQNEVKSIAMDRISNLSKLSIEELNDVEKNIHNQFFTAKSDIERYEEELNLTQEIKDKFKLLRTAIVLKETRKLALVRFSFNATALLNNISKLCDISELEVRSLTVDEVHDILINGNKEKIKDILEKSMSGVIFYIKDGKTTRYIGEDFFNKIKEYKVEEEVLSCGTKKVEKRVEASSSDSRAKVYKGMVSCRGKITAPVKIIMSSNDFDKVTLGDILVTPLTTPEYVKIFDKVKGMITFDGGGLTSHPATLSREYKIPAILGIKDLDGVLKDGDIVELDANNNSIRIM